MNPVGYPTPGKAKARLLLQAFCAGAGGTVVDTLPRSLHPGPAVFYGVTPATKPLWDQARREGRDWYYIDNAYFDSVRQVYFRVTHNRLQHDGMGVSDGRRFARLKIDIEPWRGCGEHILLCPQSAEFMQVCAEYPGSWCHDAIAKLATITDRELRVRPWNKDKSAWYKTLGQDLKGCWALVTYSSASAITAMLSGVPAFCTAPDCISRPLAGMALEHIESPAYPADRERWAGIVADQQWTLDEMRSGLTWRMLNEKNAIYA